MKVTYKGTDSGVVTINESDYDSTKHDQVREEVKYKEKKAEKKTKKKAKKKQEVF